jgi:hypothetical protein
MFALFPNIISKHVAPIIHFAIVTDTACCKPATAVEPLQPTPGLVEFIGDHRNGFRDHQ